MSDSVVPEAATGPLSDSGGQVPPQPPMPSSSESSTSSPSLEVEDRLTTEDVVLYIFGLVVALLVVIFMYSSQTSEEARMARFAATAEAMSHEAASASTKANLLRYAFSAAVFPSTTARANVSLMVGTLLALMGSFLIVRGVRDSPISGEASTTEKFQVKFAASSPGLVLALLGCTIIGLTIWRGSKFEIIETPVSESAPVGSSPENLEDLGRAARESLGL